MSVDNEKSSGKPARLSFGFTCIDQLIDDTNLGYGVVNKDQKVKPNVSCIVGPDGVGKSILALSAASTYAASKCLKARVVYASTDLNYDQASSTWEHFLLSQPRVRREKIREEIEDLYLDENLLKLARIRDESQQRELLKLNWVSPFLEPSTAEDDQQTMASIFEEETSLNEVHFLDLASYSGGDDWGLINQIVGLLRCKFKNATTPHLLIVDAIEGLETMAGNYDRFGLNRSRRSRLAQLVRLTRNANCHVIFVVEQKSDTERLDEVFISDLVLRLRAEKIDEYLQKTIEIEKARSVSHIRGTQELQIRDGKGSGYDTPNDPTIKTKDGEYIGYLQVIPSLHQKSKSRDK
jgi:KaiC/GvpD/RAD55 family RecA-like ATPase